MNINVNPINIDGKRPYYSGEELVTDVSAIDLKDARITIYLEETNLIVAKFSIDREAGMTILSVKNVDELIKASIYDILTVKIDYSGLEITHNKPYTVEDFISEVKNLKVEDFNDEETEMTRPSDYEDDYEPVGTGIWAHWAKSGTVAESISNKASYILMENGRLSLKNIRTLANNGIAVDEGEMDSFGPLSMILTWQKDGTKYGFVSF